MQSCTTLLEETFGVLTTLQEDPTIQRLETKVRQLQMKYDSVRGTAQTVVLTQQLARLQQAKALKEQVDTVCQKEAVLKAHVQPWIDEAFLIMADIEGKLTLMKAMHDLRQGFEPDSEHSAKQAE